MEPARRASLAVVVTLLAWPGGWPKTPRTRANRRAGAKGISHIRLGIGEFAFRPLSTVDGVATLFFGFGLERSLTGRRLWVEWVVVPSRL
jgi:hypothetical protein